MQNLFATDRHGTEPSHNIFSAIPNRLDSLFKPKNIAIVGATDKPGSVGRTILWNLLSSPFGGTIFPVNPKRDNLLGIKVYPSLTAITDPIDLVIVVTPAQSIPPIIQEASDKGIPGAIIISAGFKEIGPEGAIREQEILKIAKKSGMRIIGPNCLGVMNTTSGLNATFAATIAKPGHVGFLSQSGALCTAVLDWSLSSNVGFSVFASIGSMLDVDWGDLIYYLGDDPNTKSIVIYMETIGNAQSFLSAAREVALEKPIIIIKPGRTESAAKAAASHTGSLVGSDAVLDAAFKRCGVLRVDSIEELFAMADLLDKQPLPKGPKLNIITNAGGPSVIATDALIMSAGELATPTAETIAQLNQFLPDAWSHGNPIDILGDASPERYAKTLEVMSDDPNSDGILVILTPQAMTQPRETAKALTAALKQGSKPIIASWMGGNDVLAGAEVLNRSNIPAFSYPDIAAKAFSLMWRYSKNLESLYETPDSRDQDALTRIPIANISEGLRELMAKGRNTLTEAESKALLAQYQIPVTPIVIANTLEQSVEAADKIGYPVVLKIHSTIITHKSDIGGVKLNLASSEAVVKAFGEIQNAVKSLDSDVIFEGVTVQPMMKLHGTELLLGASYDPQFGPVLAFGAGGTYVELFGDVAFTLPPLNSTLAGLLIDRTKIAKALKGIRGQAPINREELEDLLVRFSYLVVNHPEIKEVEINPLLARGGSEALIALDARVILHTREAFESGLLQRNVIRAYPYEYISTITLKNAEEMTLRPILASDESAIREFHTRLTDNSVYETFKFDFPFDERTAHQRLARVCFNDYSRELSLVGVNQNLDIVGVARLSRQRVDQQTAVFRIIIQDNYHRKGLGRQMLSGLIEIAQKENIRDIYGYILHSNVPMLKLTQSFGFKGVENTDIMQVVKLTVSNKTSNQPEIPAIV